MPQPESPEEAPAPFKLGRPPVTVEEVDALHARREKAASMYAHGHSYADVARELGVAWKTAYTDVHIYLANCAKYYDAPKFRESIAIVYRKQVQRIDSMLHGILGDDPESASQGLSDNRIVAIARLLSEKHKTLAGLSNLYGFTGERTFLLAAGGAVGAALGGEAVEWAKNADADRIRDMRQRVAELYRQMRDPAVTAEFTIEGTPDKDEPALEPTSESTEPRAAPDSNASVTMSGL